MNGNFRHCKKFSQGCSLDRIRFWIFRYEAIRTASSALFAFDPMNSIRWIGFTKEGEVLLENHCFICLVQPFTHSNAIIALDLNCCILMILWRVSPQSEWVRTAMLFLKLGKSFGAWEFSGEFLKLRILISSLLRSSAVGRVTSPPIWSPLKCSNVCLTWISSTFD